jgi:uridine kinase
MIVKRDISERGRDVHGVLKQYNRYVKPSFDNYIHPTMAHADVILPRGRDNVPAIDLITRHVLRQLNERGFMFRNLSTQSDSDWKAKPLPDTVKVMDQRPHLMVGHIAKSIAID